MALRIIALIKDANKTVGYRLYDENSGAVGNFVLDEALRHLAYYECSNAELKGKDVVPTECSIERFAVLDSKFNVTKDGGIIVLNCIKKGDETIGYTLVNIKGEKIRVPKEEAIKLANKYGVSNASLVTKGGTSYLRGIKKDIPINRENLNTGTKKPDVKVTMKKEQNKKLEDEAIIHLSCYTSGENKTDYEVGFYVELKNLTDEQMQKVKSKKYIGFVTDFNDKDCSARLSLDLVDYSFSSCMHTMVAILNDLDMAIDNIMFVAGLCSEIDGFIEIQGFECGKLENAKASKLSEDNVTPLISLMSCKKDLKGAYAIALESNKCSSNIIEKLKLDLEFIKTL